MTPMAALSGRGAFQSKGFHSEAACSGFFGAASIQAVIAGESTVYPFLRRLEADGLLTSRWLESNSGPPRKYYELSDAGLAFLRSAQREWDAIVETMIRLQGEGDGGQAVVG